MRWKSLIMFLFAAALLALSAPTAEAQGAQSPVITSLTIKSPHDVSTGQTVWVQMTGTPACVATFDVAGIHDVLMREISPGTYLGSFIVEPGMRTMNAPLRGALALGDRRTSFRSEATLTVVDNGSRVVAAPPALAIAVPVTTTRTVTTTTTTTAPVAMFLDVDRPQYGNIRDFTVTGRTRPFSRIQATARLEAQAADGTTFRQTVTSSGTADALGAFALPVHLPTGMPPRNVQMSVVATDAVTSATRKVEFDIATGD